MVIEHAAELNRRAGTQRIPLGAQVAALIRERIVESGATVGEPLPSESALADEYGVSQRVVRDALRVLNHQGVIRTHQGKRAEVSELRPVAMRDYFKFAVVADAESSAELMELRLYLETLVARLAASRADDGDIARIRELLAEVKDSGTDLERRVPADLALHNAIAGASGNRFFQAILEALSQAMSEERRLGGELTQAAGSTHKDSNDSHEDLVEAIAAGDPDRAAEAARVIVERARDVFSARDNSRA